MQFILDNHNIKFKGTLREASEKAFLYLKNNSDILCSTNFRLLNEKTKKVYSIIGLVNKLEIPIRLQENGITFITETCQVFPGDINSSDEWK